MKVKELIIGGTGFSILGFLGSVDIGKITISECFILTLKTVIVSLALLEIIDIINRQARKYIRRQKVIEAEKVNRTEHSFYYR